jgi:hypothetical protein
VHILKRLKSRGSANSEKAQGGVQKHQKAQGGVHIVESSHIVERLKGECKS